MVRYLNPRPRSQIRLDGFLTIMSPLGQKTEGAKMSEIEYHLPETFLEIVKKDSDHRIFLLDGKKLIFFPA